MMVPVRIRLLWHPQAQFAGYLLAQHRGLAAARSIALECQPVAASVGPVEAVLSGACEFAVASPAHVVESTAPEALTLLAVIQQASPLVYPARRADGIERPGDLAGKRIAVWPGSEHLELRWMLQRLHVPPASVELVPALDTAEALLRADVSCAQMTTYHEWHAFEARAESLEDYIIFRAGDAEASLIKDGLVARRDYVAAHLAVVQHVLDSVLAGWTRAFDDPAEAVAVCSQVRGDLSPAEHARQLHDIRTLSLTRATLSHGLGFPDPAHMTRALEAVARVDGRRPPHDVPALVDDRFWRAAPVELRGSRWN